MGAILNSHESDKYLSCKNCYKLEKENLTIMKAASINLFHRIANTTTNWIMDIAYVII